MNIYDIDTPALILDKRAFYENIETMKKITQGGAMLRPHYKSNKCAEIARIQLENGACGITCSKLGEAEDLVGAGVENILVANEITVPSKITRLAELAKRTHLTVCVDSAENIAALDRAAGEAGSVIHCYIEFDIGMNRCGVFSREEAADLAELTASCKNLTFDGIQAYAGQLSHEYNEELRRCTVERNNVTLLDLKKYLSARGLPTREISGCSTGTVELKAKGGVYTELQCGSYIFMDVAYGKMGLPFKSSLFILANVIEARDGVVITDTGAKACSFDQCAPVGAGLPDGAEIEFHEEHGLISLDNTGKKYKVNDRIKLIPGHCCTTVNLYDKIYVVDGESVIDTIHVTARGKSY